MAKKFLLGVMLAAIFARVASGAVSSGDTALILSRFDAIDKRLEGIDARLSKVERQVENLAGEISHTTDRLEDFRHTVYWMFAVLGLISAGVPMWLSLRKDTRGEQPPVITITPPAPPAPVIVFKNGEYERVSEVKN